MGRIFISAGHGGRENGAYDPGSIVAGTTEAREMILTRDLILTEVRSRQFEVLSVPDDLSTTTSIDWIRARARPTDIALEIHAEAFPNPSVRGSSIYYIANNDQRKQHAELLLLSLLRRVPQLPNRGAKPDTAMGIGSLAFCRLLTCPSLYLEIGFLSNPDDRFIIQNRRRDVATGIADGLVAWSLAVDPAATERSATVTYPTCNISINGQIYGEQGIIVNGNSYIPIDLADRLGVDVSTAPNVVRITYRNIVYVKAVDLRPYNISIEWNSTTRTVSLRSIFQICPGQIDKIPGHGNASEVQLMMFLKTNHESGLVQFPEIARLYREEGAIEGINFDIAFAQMCLETNFLRFGGIVKPSQNNFAGLGAVGGGEEGASFPSARIGVRAHIQHLKAYGNTEPLVQDVVDPRFNFVTRGIAPLVGMLSGRWSADEEYGNKILAILRRLYETAKLM
jgi:hypothetical protein